MQRGSRIIVHFTPPQQTTEGRAIKPPVKLDLRIGTPVAPFNAETWAAQAREIPASGPANGPVQVEIPSADWTGKEVSLAVRAIGSNGKTGEWSNFVNLTVVPPPARPGDLKAEAAPEGVRLAWQGDGGDFVVLRRAGDEKSFTQVGEAQGAEYLDRTAEFGKPYVYLVQRIVKLANGRIAESDLSNEAAITPVDTFPPAAPTGLHAVAAPQSIELTWDRNREPDLSGYRVYRAVRGSALQKIADVSLVPAFSDHNVQAGAAYEYAVSAVDRAGNESPRSAPVELQAQ